MIISQKKIGKSTCSSNGGSTISAGLPNITGTSYTLAHSSYGQSGAISYSYDDGARISGSSSNYNNYKINFNAKNSNSIYGNSSTVQPPAYKIYAWKRTS